MNSPNKMTKPDLSLMPLTMSPSKGEKRYSFMPDMEIEQEYRAKQALAADAYAAMNKAISDAHVALNMPSWQFAGGTDGRAQVIDAAIKAIYVYDQVRASLSATIETGLARKQHTAAP